MKLILSDIKTECLDTKSFFFKPEKSFRYLPGQYYYFTLPKLDYDDARGPTRHFTLSSSPTESLLRLTTKIRDSSGFKKTLEKLPLGSIIEGEGPTGTFILDENEPGSHVLIAGGIGITPFRSFIKYNIDKKLTDTFIHLIYSNSTHDEITFYNDLIAWEKNYKNIKVDMTITKPSDSDRKWKGLTGRIDDNMIKKLTDYKSTSNKFWLCGPPIMVSSMESILTNLNISSKQIYSEKFTGY